MRLSIIRESMNELNVPEGKQLVAAVVESSKKLLGQKPTIAEQGVWMLDSAFFFGYQPFFFLNRPSFIPSVVVFFPRAFFRHSKLS